MHTQCPKCRTIFNVTEQILAVKAGLVRCGDCENVFNATWNLVDEADEFDEEAAETPAVIRQTPAHAPARRADDTDRVIDDGPHDAPHGPAAGEPHDDIGPGRHAWLEPPIDEQPQAEDDDDDIARHERAFGGDPRDPFALDDDDAPNADHEDAGAEISDEEIHRTLRLDHAFDDDTSDNPREADRNDPHDDDPHDDDPHDDDPHDDDPHDDEPHDDEPHDDEPHDDEPLDDRRDAPLTRPGAPHEEDHDEPAAARRPRHGTPHGARIEPRLDAAPSGGLSVSADDGLLPRRTPSRSAADRSPLQRRPAIQLKAPAASASGKPPEAAREARVDPNVHWVSIPDNDRRGAQFLWASGVLLLIVLLTLQVRFFLVDELYSIPGTRPYISLFCEFAGCSAPQRADPGAIDIAQTRVDLHPEVPGAIRINVNLINRAAFAQPYPALELTLSDKDGRIVGRRTYQPADYLREDAGTALLDPGILAVAAINLAHPNENAVGFQTRVVASTPN